MPPGTPSSLPSDPVEDLVVTAARTIEPWLVDSVVRTARTALGRCPDELERLAVEMAAVRGPQIVAELEGLVRLDVDAQRSNPLSILRDAIRYPTELLRAAGIPAVDRDQFAVERFPADVYGLGPASWAEVHPDLHDVGIMWGAWKAAIVLQRRRAEGRR